MCAQENSREYNYNPYLYFVSSICNTLNVRFLIPRLRQHAPYNLYLENGKIFICSFFFNIHKERAQYVVVWICLRLLASFVYMYLFDYFSLSILTNRIWCGGARSLKVYNHKHHIGRIHQIYFIWFLGAGVVFCVPHQCRLRRRHYYMGKSIRSHNNLQWLMVLDN